MMLSQKQQDRYERHLILNGFGMEAQERLLQSKALVVGAGGLGSPVMLYLAASGVGSIGIVDGDRVSISNLQRQVIHSTSDIGRLKVEVARERMVKLNPDVKVESHDCFLSKDNAEDIICDYDFVVDATDNFKAKYLVNDACVRLDKPFSMGGVSRYGGQVMTHVPGTACYRCLFPHAPAPEDVELGAVVGVLSPLVGMLGTIQATECIKWLAGVGELLTNSLLVIDALSMRHERLSFEPDAGCDICGTRSGDNKQEDFTFKPF